MIAIRRATLQDLPQILRFRRAMLSDMGSTSEEALERMEIAAAAFLREGFLDSTCFVWIAEEQAPVGCGMLHVVPWIPSSVDASARRVWVHNVYTEPGHRRRGIASEIMQTMLAWCRAEGFRSVSLHASEHGRRIYELLGFRPSNEMRLFW
ncbi:MAG TPA: GNAT family N-acetyltransferase [Candidatus Sulfopaludibacter sp.]|jgi:GNAT superfamily N-acetyltransferase|nr:GNAT family N-acetyltransferase [Candidatus Sulfopaludibacter sp.]